MASKFALEIRSRDSLSQSEQDEIVQLCARAFEEDYTPYLQTFIDPIHVLGKLDGKLVSHALWITRWMQIEGLRLLRTAYVEGVATEDAHRCLGYASQVMQHLVENIQDYQIAALSPADTNLYTRLGWEFWEGPLFARKGVEWVPVPGERVMVFRLPKTPALDLSAPISVEWREGEVW